MKFEAADRWLKSRLQMPTALNTRGLAELESGIRAHAFFSARVAEARVLDAIREVSDRYSRGELDLATARATIKERLGTRRAPGSKEDSRLTDICSTARLDLILGQNARMAYAVGEYEQGMDTMARRLFPAWRYVRSTAASPRAKHAAYAGRVWMKDDPVWRSIFPPSDFGCRCSVEEVSADEIDGGSARVEGRTADKDVPPHAKSGFSFDPEEALRTIDPTVIKDEFRRQEAVMQLLENDRTQDMEFIVGKFPPMSFKEFNDGAGAMPSYETQGRRAVPTSEEKAAIAGEIDRLVAMMPQDGTYKERVANLPEASVVIGRILPSHCRALGLDPAKAKIVFNSRGSIDEGLKHWLKHHADTLNGRDAIDLMEKTIWNPKAKARIERRNRKTRLIYEWKDRDGNALCSLFEFDKDGTWNVIDAWVPNDQYFERRTNKK